MKHFPVVSVVIPTYRRVDRLLRAIDSVYHQDYPSIEVIVADDNPAGSVSQVATERAVLAHQAAAIYLSAERNEGGAAARNRGARIATGKYVAFLDDDDEFLPGKVRQQVSLLELHPSLVACTCSLFRDGRVIDRTSLPENLAEAILAMDFAPVTSTLMIRRDVFLSIDGFDPNFRRHQDLEMTVRLLEQGGMGTVAEPLLIMGINAGENMLQGDDLKNVKTHLIQSLSPVINRIDSSSPGAKDRIIAAHAAALFISYLFNRNIARAMELMISELKVSKRRRRFLRQCCRRVKRGTAAKLHRVLGKRDGKRTRANWRS